MKLYDISVSISARVPVWPGDRSPQIVAVSRTSDGDLTNLSEIHASLHTGTHVDAPRHIHSDGLAIDEIALELFYGRCRVVEILQRREINRDVLQSLNWEGVSRVLFKTTNSNFWQQPVPTFRTDYAALTPDGAQFLLQQGIQLVGIDYLSIDLYENTDLPVHRILLRNNVVVVEALNLFQIAEGDYELFCFPIKIHGSDGAPARAVLKDVFE